MRRFITCLFGLGLFAACSQSMQQAPPTRSVCDGAFAFVEEETLLAPGPEADSASIQLAERAMAVAVTKADMNAILIATQRFCWSTGRYPETAPELIAFGRQFGDGSDCVMRRPPGEDAWGSAYRVEWTRERTKITSAGQDRYFGTADDLSLPLGGPEGVRLTSESCNFPPVRD